MHIPDVDAVSVSDANLAELSVQPLHDSTFDLRVTGPSKVEYAWQQCAMTAESKRRRLERPKLPWEQTPFNEVFRTAGKWHGTAVDHLSDMLQPSPFGIHDALHSTLVIDSSALAFETTSAPPVIKLNLRHVRRESPDEDIRRVALSKMREILLQDPLASQLGVSITKMLDSGCSTDIVDQSLSDFFRMKPRRRCRREQDPCGGLQKPSVNLESCSHSG